MTPAEFRQLLTGTADTDLLGPCLRDPLTPYAFDPDPPAWDAFRTDVSTALGFDQADMAVIGSGRLGFSLRPGSNLKAFNDRSDVDVVVVNAALFDQLWYDLLRAAYPRPPLLNQLASGWLRDRQKELYTGWLTPAAIRLDARIVGPRARPALDFRLRWFDTFKKAARHLPRRHEDINTRLYRTWRHAELYHLDSLAALRKALAT